MFKKVSIIIQARSTSSRFPGKIFEKIGSKQILQLVLDSCYKSASYINEYAAAHGVTCSVALAVPKGDMLIPVYSENTIIEGPEADVLTRYKIAADKLDSDYIVRITSDCPLIPSFVISKAIGWATKGEFDFLTNADPRYRTMPDGYDCEVISRKLLNWLDENAKDPFYREHVTNYLIDHLPAWAKKADIIGFARLNSVKLSVDTKEDLQAIREQSSYLVEAVKKSPKPFRL